MNSKTNIISIEKDAKRKVYNITYSEPNGTKVIEEVSFEDYDNMLSIMKKAKLADGTDISSVCSVVEISTSESNDKLNEIQNSIQSEIDLINQNMNELKTIVNNFTKSGDVSWKIMEQQNATKMATITKMINNVKVFVDEEITKTNNDALRHAEVINQLKSENDLNWEDTRTSLSDMNKMKNEISSYMSNIDSKIVNLNNEMNSKLREVDLTINEARTTLDKTYKEFNNKINDMIGNIDESSKNSTKRNKSKEDIKRKKEYVKNKLKIKRERDKKKQIKLKEKLKNKLNSLTDEAKKSKSKFNKLHQAFTDIEKDLIEKYEKVRSKLSRRLEELNNEKVYISNELTDNKNIDKQIKKQQIDEIITVINSVNVEQQKIKNKESAIREVGYASDEIKRNMKKIK